MAIETTTWQLCNFSYMFKSIKKYNTLKLNTTQMSFFMYQTTIPNKKKTPIKPPLSPIRPLLWRGCNQKHTSPKDFFRKAKLIDGKTHLKLYNSLSLVPVLLLASSIPLYAYVLQISQNNNELQQKLLRHEVHEKFSGWNKGEFVILIFNICCNQ